MALKGDFAKLHKMVLKVQRLGQPEALQDLSDNLAEEAVDLVKAGFAAETDPYGKRWPNKVFGDGRQVLVGRSQQLRGGWHPTRLDHKGFRISPSKSAPYAKYHQGGTGIFGPKKKPITGKNGGPLSFFAEGYVTRAAASKVRYSAMSGYQAKAGASVAQRMRGMRSAGAKAVSGMNGSTIIFRSVKGCPKRMMVPRKGDLPAAWGQAFEECSHDWFRSYFKKR